MIPGFIDLTYYEILDISIAAEPKELQEAYYRVRSAFSKNALASYSLYTQEQRDLILRLIEEAYHTLFDEKARQEYDQQLGQEKLRSRREAKARQEVLPLTPMREETPPPVGKKPGLEDETTAPEPGPDESGLEASADEEASESRPGETEPSEGTPEEKTRIEPSPNQTEKTALEASKEEKKAALELTPEPDKEPVEKPAEDRGSRTGEPAHPVPKKPPAQPAAEPSTPRPAIRNQPPIIIAKRSEVVRHPYPRPGQPPGISIREAQIARDQMGKQEGEAKTEQEISVPGFRFKRGPLPRDREKESRPGPVRAQSSSLAGEVKKKISAAAPEPPARGRELFEDTIYDLPPPRKTLNPLDYLDSEFSGAFLKKTREEKGHDLDQVWEATRIRKPILVAIEDEKYKDLPADVFLKGMLMIYIRFLELEDPEAVVKSYMERVIAARDWMD